MDYYAELLENPDSELFLFLDIIFISILTITSIIFYVSTLVYFFAPYDDHIQFVIRKKTSLVSGGLEFLFFLVYFQTLQCKIRLRKIREFYSYDPCRFFHMMFVMLFVLLDIIWLVYFFSP